jgi:hypothetical protein
VKKRMKKLSLNRETLRSLDIVGGSVLVDQGGVVVITRPQPFTTSETISICKYCTTPLDTCPPPTTGTIA